MTGKQLGAFLLLMAVCVPLRAADTVVFPLENRTGSPELEWLSYGIAFAVEDSLGARSWLDRLDAMERMDLPETTGITVATRFAVARQMGSRYVIVGWYDRAGEQIRLHLDRYDREAGRREQASGRISMDRLLSDIVGVVSQMGGKNPYPAGLMDSHEFEWVVRALVRARFSGDIDPLPVIAGRYDSIPAIQRRIGHLAFQAGELELSWQCFNRMDVLDERDLLAAGLSGVRTGRTGEALTYFLRGLGKGRRNGFLLNAAGCLVKSGNFREALLVLQDAVPSEVAAFDRAVTLAALGQWADVIETMSPLLGGMAGHPAYRTLMRMACRHVPDAVPCALPDLMSSEQDPSSTPETVATLYRFVDTLEDDEMLDLEPLKQAYIGLAKRYLAAGETRQSIATLRKLLTLDPLNIAALCIMCRDLEDNNSCDLLERLHVGCDDTLPAPLLIPDRPGVSASD